MKLAEALQQRADLNLRIMQLRQRLSFNVVVQEGEQPAENPVDLMTELDECINQLEDLIRKINLINCKTVVEGKTLTEWIAQRDSLKLKIESYRGIVERASNLCGRMTRSEIKCLATINVRDVQKQVDSLSAELRRTDNLIQQANWTTEF